MRDCVVPDCLRADTGRVRASGYLARPMATEEEMRTPLFDVVIQNAGDAETGEMFITVQLIDRYHDGPDIGKVIGEAECDSLDAALEWARGAVTAFMKGTEA